MFKALENTVQNDQEKNETKPLPENLIQNEWENSQQKRNITKRLPQKQHPL